MSQMPRIAVGTIQAGTIQAGTIQAGATQAGVDRLPILWGLLDRLAHAGLRTQSFQSQSRLCDRDASLSVMRHPYRYLDPSLMSAGTCREFLWHGSRTVEMAIVEGSFAGDSSGSRLGRLAEWLDAPRIAIVDALRLDGCASVRPRFPIDAVLLQNASESSHHPAQTCIESLWGAPVIGAMRPCGALLETIQTLPEGEPPSRELCAALGRHLNLTRPEYLMALADERRLPSFETRLFREGAELAGLRVAVACDRAFPTNFPETLDLLELHGASVECFSPLHDDGLPEDTNMVLLGDGLIERFAAELASNHCLKHSLQAYVREGGRIYAQGGGLVWLGRQVVLSSREALPMAGVLPIVSCRDSRVGESQDSHRDESPVELTLASDAWLGETGAHLRGYLDDRWRICSMEQIASLASEPERRHDFIRHGQVIGSRVLLHFAAQREFLESLFRPSVEAGLTCRV